MISLHQRLLRRINNYRREKSVKKAHHEHRFEHKQDYLQLDHIVNRFRASGGLKHEYQAYKLWCLKDLLARYKPERILELGSGTSTSVFASYVRKHKASLLSIDEDEMWASNTSNLIDIKKTDKIEIRAEKKIFVSDTVPPEIRYDIRIKEKFDFVFIDGPSLQIDGIKHKEAVNSNVFELPYFPEIVVVDARKATAECLLHKYGDEYDAHLSDLFSGKPVKNGYNYFSIFVKKAKKEKEKEGQILNINYRGGQDRIS